MISVDGAVVFEALRETTASLNALAGQENWGMHFHMFAPRQYVKLYARAHPFSVRPEPVEWTFTRIGKSFTTDKRRVIFLVESDCITVWFSEREQRFDISVDGLSLLLRH